MEAWGFQKEGVWFLWGCGLEQGLVKLRDLTFLSVRTFAVVVCTSLYLLSSRFGGSLLGRENGHRRECCHPGISFLLPEIACGLFVCPEYQSESSKAHLEYHGRNL